MRKRRGWETQARIDELEKRICEREANSEQYISDSIIRARRHLHDLVWSEDKGISIKEIKNHHYYIRYLYYPGKIYHLNGDTDNSWGNLVMICPCCEADIKLSRFSPKDIWLWKVKGLNYAEIGRILNLSRERVRQLCKRHEAQMSRIPEVDIDNLVKEAQARQRILREDGKLKRLTDKRTLRKRIINELAKLGASQAKNIK